MWGLGVKGLNTLINRWVRFLEGLKKGKWFTKNETFIECSKFYQKSQILKFQDNIKVTNYLYVHNSLNNRLPVALTDKFQYIHENHSIHTRHSAKQCIKLPIARTSQYAIYSIDGSSARTWNSYQITHHKSNLHLQSPYSCKKTLTQHLLSTY